MKAQQERVLQVERILHGFGALAALPSLLDELGVQRALLITSASGAKAGLGRMVAERSEGRVVEVLADVLPHNLASVALKATALAESLGVDGIVSVGGGSAIDAGKATRLLAQSQARDLASVRELWHANRSGSASPGRSRLSLIALPTTLSGAEFSFSCAITDDASREKMIFARPEYAVSAIVLDPALTAATPATLWASTGVKLIDHAVEQIYSTQGHPVSRAQCLAGLEILYRELPLSLADRGSSHSLACMYAKWLISFGMMNVTLGLSHGTGHQIGPLWGLPHGVTSCVTMPHALRFNAEYAVEAEADIARAIGLEVGAASPAELSRALSGALQEFIRSLALPTTLKEVGGRREDFAALAPRILRDPIAAGNPRPLSSPEDVERFLNLAWAGHGELEAKQSE